jgi:DNA-binding beta-propeller fold protein YncE
MKSYKVLPLLMLVGLVFISESCKKKGDRPNDPGKNSNNTNNPPKQLISIFAGKEIENSTEGPRLEAGLGRPVDLAFGPDGTLYFTALENKEIRKISPEGLVSSLPVKKYLKSPSGIAVASDGTLYVSDSEKNRLFKIAPSGILTTVEICERGANGRPTNCELKTSTDLAVGPDGSIYIAEYSNKKIRRIAPDGISASLAPEFKHPYAVTVAKDGTVYVAEASIEKGISRIRRIGTDGSVSTLAGGQVGFQDGNGENARFSYMLQGLIVGEDGNLYVSDVANWRIRKITPSGIVTTIAGRSLFAPYIDGPALETSITAPGGLAIRNGVLYFTNNLRIHKLE